MPAGLAPRQIFVLPDFPPTTTLLVTTTEILTTTNPATAPAVTPSPVASSSMATAMDTPLDSVTIIADSSAEPGASAPTTDAAAPVASMGDMGPLLNYTVWIMTGVSLTILLIRLYCKATRSRKLWWDDYVLTLAWMCLAVAAAMTTVSVNYGYGRPFGAVTLADLLTMPRFANVAGFFSVLAAMWSKVSFGLTLARISEGWVLRFVCAVIATIVLVMGSSAVLVIVEIPVDLRTRYFLFATAYSGAMDITLSILPWKIIWSLRMTTREKAGVLIAMSMGVFAGAMSFIKATKVPSLQTGNPVDNVQLVIFGIAEGATAIIAASIPVLRALIREGKTQWQPREVELDPIDSKIPLRRISTAASDLETNGRHV